MKISKNCHTALDAVSRSSSLVRHCEEARSADVAIKKRRCHLVVQPQSAVIPEGLCRESAVAVSNHPIFKSSTISGFSLMELVTVIAVLVILTVISAPIYQSYSIRAKQAEGYLILATIRSAQEHYFNDHATYLKASDSTAGNSNDGFTSWDKVFDIKATGCDYYKWFNINDGTIDEKIGYQSIVTAKYGNITLVFNRTTGATAL